MYIYICIYTYIYIYLRVTGVPERLMFSMCECVGGRTTAKNCRCLVVSLSCLVVVLLRMPSAVRYDATAGTQCLFQ